MENEIKNMRLVQIRDKFRCEFVEYVAQEDLDPSKQIYITDEDRLAIGLTKCFDVENNCVIDYDNTIDKIIEHKNELRAKRVPLLKAFDVYKSSVAYGVEFENEEQREEIVKWYGDLLHLEESAFEDIPERIRYYL
jgi:hypothetical protein